MRKTGKFTKRVAVIGTVAALAVGGGVAWAAWTATGQGTGSAEAATAKPLTATVSTVTGLYPGATSNVTLTVANQNPYPVLIKTITGTVSTSKSGCPASSVVFSIPSTEEYGVVPAQNSASLTLENAVSMPNATANNNCQGATFDLKLTISGESTTASATP